MSSPLDQLGLPSDDEEGLGLVLPDIDVVVPRVVEQPAGRALGVPAASNVKIRARKRNAASNCGAAQEQAQQAQQAIVDLPHDVVSDDLTDLIESLEGDVPLPAFPIEHQLPELRKRGKKRLVPHYPGATIDELMNRTPTLVLLNDPSLAESVPLALDGTLPDDLAEVYSPPRVAAQAVKAGMRASLSADLLTGWNLAVPDERARLVQEIRRRRPKVLILSPPCTWFSGLMNFNWSKLPVPVREKALKLATTHLEFCMFLASTQHKAGRGWLFEHPAAAKSWKNTRVCEVSGMPGVQRSSFDQCRFGLKSKVDKRPMKKRTSFLSNMPSVGLKFCNSNCLGCPDHVVIQGSEGGVKRSVWAQRYPELLCQEICSAARVYIQGQA